MKKLLLEKNSDFKSGQIVERKNRFIISVDFGSSIEKVYLANPGALSTVIALDREVLCEYSPGPNRKTDFDAFAIKVDDIYVTVRSTFANEIFSQILEDQVLDIFEDYTYVKREPKFPEHGRADFLLEKDRNKTYIEVKSCTHVENGIAKFPDRPTDRGKRHLRSLIKLVEKRKEGFIFFIVQRNDASELRPFRKVDPEFSDLLKKANDQGVGVRAISIIFEPPKVFLSDDNLPIRFV